MQTIQKSKYYQSMKALFEKVNSGEINFVQFTLSIADIADTRVTCSYQREIFDKAFKELVKEYFPEGIICLKNDPEAKGLGKEEIKRLIFSGLTITDVIDVVVELNGFIGVGLISLGDGLQKYVYDKIR